MDTTKNLTPTTDVGFDSNRWQICCNGLSGRLGALRTQGLWTDCELIVGSSQGRMLAHRILLGSASPVLATIIFGPLAPSDHKYYFPNIEPDTFNRLLEFIYTDTITVESCEVACNLYKAADYLNMPHVASVCKASLLDNLTTKDALQVYELGKMFEEYDMIEKSLEVMSRNVEELFSDCWVPADTLETLFLRRSQGFFPGTDLACKSELDLLTIAEEWVLANTPFKEDDQDPNAANDKRNIAGGDADSTEKKADSRENGADDKKDDPKTLIRGALQHIRFLTIDPIEFAERDLTMLLTDKEILAISLNLLSKDAHMPMPEGFSNIREIRSKIN